MKRNLTEAQKSLARLLIELYQSRNQPERIIIYFHPECSAIYPPRRFGEWTFLDPIDKSDAVALAFKGLINLDAHLDTKLNIITFQQKIFTAVTTNFVEA